MAFSLRPLKPEIYPAGTFRIPREDCVFRVGRDEANDLCVEHASVSAAHAKLEVLGEEGVEVIDCGSSNGTFVNGIRVERRRLADGDLLRFASAEFRVVGLQNGGGGENGATHSSLEIDLPLVELAIRRKLGQKPLILKCLRRFPELSHGTM